MTKQEAIQKFREHWRELARTGSRCKSTAHPEAEGWNAYCALCDYCNSAMLRCSGCPVMWPGKRCDYVDGGLYGEWRREDNKEKRKVLAARISELPEKRKRK